MLKIIILISLISVVCCLDITNFCMVLGCKLEGQYGCQLDYRGIQISTWTLSKSCMPRFDYYQKVCDNRCLNITNKCYNNYETNPKVSYYNDYCEISSLLNNNLPQKIDTYKPILKCPGDCINNNGTCLSLTGSVCEFNKETLLCPLGCKLNHETYTCRTHNGDDCSQSYGCKHGDTFKNNVCYSNYNKCCNCEFNPYYKSCVPNEKHWNKLVKNHCGRSAYLTCPDKFKFNKVYPECSNYNISKICMFNDKLNIPYDKLNEISNIKCQFSTDYQYCTLPYKVLSCPGGTVKINNRCVIEIDGIYYPQGTVADYRTNNCLNNETAYPIGNSRFCLQNWYYDN